MNNLLKKAKDIMSVVTPIKSDCGELCYHRCCQVSEDKDTPKAMWLFPYEDSDYIKNADFDIIKSDGNMGYSFISCKHSHESCKRGLRPLFCCFFPFFPAISSVDGEYKINIIPHPSAVLICPLLDTKEHKFSYTSDFFRCIRKSAYIMLQDEELKKYLIKTGDYLLSILKMTARFTGERI